VSNAPSKPVSFSRPKVGYFSNRPRNVVSTKFATGLRSGLLGIVLKENSFRQQMCILHTLMRSFFCGMDRIDGADGKRE